MPIIIVLFALFAALGFGGYFYTHQTTSAQAQIVVTKDQNSFANATFKDGTYTATSTYRTPGGDNPEVNLSITLAGGVVTSSDFSATNNGQGPTSDYQGKFKAAYQSLVVGKKLSDIKLSRVGGASLTTGGFDSALVKIENEAKS
jgi:uncharacterized protein with FMN-binding domain